MTRTFVVLALIAAAVAPMAVGDSGSNDLDSKRGVIFPAGKAVSLCFCDKNTIAGAWTPTSEDVETLEPILTEAMVREMPQQPWGGVSQVRPRNYYRQYGGLYLHGRRVIISSSTDFTNGRCSAHRICGTATVGHSSAV